MRRALLLGAVVLALAGCDRFDRGFGDDGVVRIELGVATGARVGETLGVFGMDEGRPTVARYDIEGRLVGEPVHLPIAWPASASLAGSPDDGWVLATSEGRFPELTLVWDDGAVGVFDGHIDPTGIAVAPDGTVIVPNSRSMHVALVPRKGMHRIVETRVGHFGNLRGAAVAADGSFVVAGQTTVDLERGEVDLVLERYHADGRLDTTWAWHGVSLVDLGGVYDEVQAITMDPQGRVLVSALSSRHGATRQWVLRFTPDGRLDPSFGGDGRATAGVDLHGEGRTIHVRPDGRIVTAGVAILGDHDFLATQWLPDGRLDDAWGDGGTNRTDLGAYEHHVAGALLADGRLLTAGWADGDVLARYQAP